MKEVHAYWAEYKQMRTTFQCSNCGYKQLMAFHKPNYCPDCGAKMDADPPEELQEEE